MLPDIRQKGSVSLFLRRRLPVALAVISAVLSVLVQLPGAVGAVKFMALTGRTGKSDDGKQQEEAIHGRAV